MELLSFYLSNTNLPRGKLIFHSTLAGGANVFVLALLNAAADNAQNSEVELVLVLLFALNILIFLLSQRYIWENATVEVERLVHKERMGLVAKLNACNLEKLENMQKSDIYAAINQHSGNIAFAGVPTIVSLQSFILLCFSLLYVLWLSLSAFILLAGFLSIAVYFSLKRAKYSEQCFAKAFDKEQSAYATITDLLEGFKEVKLHQQREQSLLHYAEQLSFDAEAARMVSNRHLALSYVATQASFYITIALMVFLLPLFETATFTGVIISITTAAIFLTGPINVILSVVPTYTNSKASLQFIKHMNQALDKAKDNGTEVVSAMAPFETVKFNQICYRFDSDKGDGFSIGPVSLEIKRGDIVFVTGGNGSGKSTLIKAMLGLYRIHSGNIEYNGRALHDDDLASYRNCFSAIFTDFHLFKRLYGIDNIDAAEVAQWLELFQLADKTKLIDGEFTTQNLSTGQRKRLALLVAIIEKRPILVLDEWAADQDPQYRQVFYQQILPKIKQQGTTVLAITHDEQYFALCDARYHLIDGKLAQPN